jgi:hypothetical protein
LMKISSYEKAKGHTVRYFQGDPFMSSDWRPDKIYVTSSIFSWYVPESIWTINRAKERWPDAEVLTGGVMASINPEYFEKQTGIKPHVGILWEVEGFRPDYEGFNWTSSSLVFTSRGCWVNCDFCCVPRIETTTVHPIRGWESHVVEDREILVLQDNNLTATPWSHFWSVMAFLKAHKFRVDLNSGIEPHSFTEKHAREMAGIRWQPLRTAFDEITEEKVFTNTMELIKAYLQVRYSNLMVYVLFNFQDTPDEALYRALKVVELGGSPWPMPYRPLDWFSKDDYVSAQWTLEQVKKFYRFWSRGTIWRSVLKMREGKITHYPTLKEIFEYERR